jgi:FimV-like protein
MITAIIKSYLTPLLSIGLGTLSILVLGIYFIFRNPRKEVGKEIVQTFDDESIDVSAIAGDNVTTTQLDLARAYIETGRKHLAKNILETVVKQGSVVQQEEAQRLLISVISG